jgi:hypothetical protein
MSYVLAVLFRKCGTVTATICDWSAIVFAAGVLLKVKLFPGVLVLTHNQTGRPRPDSERFKPSFRVLSNVKNLPKNAGRYTIAMVDEASVYTQRQCAEKFS